MEASCNEEEIRKWIVTILDRTNIERALGSVVDIVKEQGLELDLIQALSHVQPDGFITTPEGGRAYSCAQVHAYGRLENEAQMRAEYRRLADEIAVDIAVQTEEEHRREKRLFCFDMDSTLIQGEVIDELAKMAGVADRVVAITASAMRGEIEFQESFRRRVALLSGLPATRAQELLDRIPLMEGTERLFRTLKSRGCKTAILSGGFTFFGEYLQRKLDVDYVFANELDVDAEGFITGQVRGQIVDGARKAELLVEIATREGIPLAQVVAVGDGANDLPMLQLAAMGVAFHAKPVVRASAAFSVSHLGLDSLLYLLGIPDREWVAAEAENQTT
jgi:phosphoserine phosphatase